MHDVDVFRCGRDDIASYALTNDGAIVADLSSITRVVVELRGATLDSSVQPALFDWTIKRTVDGQSVDVLAINFGMAGLAATVYDATIVTYDPSNPNGVPWGDRNLRGVV